jgi:transcription-repair coupling factor (superfamily II helicase)
MNKTISIIFAVVIVYAGLALSSVAAIEAQGTSADRRASSPTEVGDKELRSFAKSYIEFHKIRMEFERALSQASDPQEKNRLEQEAVAKFGKAVEKHGLTAESYLRIFQTVNANDAIRQKALQFIDEERKRS